MSLFIAPLHKTSLSKDSSIGEIIYVFFRSSSINEADIVDKTFSRNGNSVTLLFKDLHRAQLANASIRNQFLDTYVTKITDPPKAAPCINLPVQYDDSLIPPGFQIIPEYLTESEEEELLHEIDSMEWDCTIKRRVQHYGFRFQYSKLDVDKDTPVTPFPPLCQSFLERGELTSCGFNQLTVNEYVPGIGIASHCDTHSAFTDTIAVISVGSSITMDFVSACNSKRVSVEVPRRSLSLMTGESRYGWRHGIASRKTDIDLDGNVVQRQRRVSLTFRNCIDAACTCKFPALCNSQGSDIFRPRRMQEG